MTTETAAVVAVETVRAGANLVGDHLAGAEWLSVEHGWDFRELGGQLSVAGTVYTYTSATYPVDNDDDPTILALDGLLAADADDGEPVFVEPESVEKIAHCQIADFDEVVLARVDHALHDKIPDGIRGDLADAETVRIELEGSTWVVRDVIGKSPEVDGSYIDPDTLPASPPQEPVPPSTAPTPEVFQPGTQSLGIKWQAVENATPVDYDVYLSSAPGAYAPANFLASTAASMAISNTLPDGTPMEHGQTYYWQIQPRSGTAMGPVSTEVSGTLAQINSADIVAAAITADLLAANSVTAAKLASLIVISGEFTTAEAGARSGISAALGHFGFGPDGELVFQVKGGSAYFDGAVNARTLNVVEGATWSGNNVGSPGAETMMGNKLGAPANPPTVEAFWDEIALDGGDVAGDDDANRRGLVWHSSHWWVASYDGSGIVLLKFDATGSHVATFSGPSDGAASSSLTLLGSTFYVRASGYAEMKTFNATTGAYVSSVSLSGFNLAMLSNGKLGADGTNLILAWVGTSGNLNWQKYTTAGALSGSQVSTGASLFDTPTSALGGSFDLGASRVIVSGEAGAYSFTTAGTPQSAEHFNSPGVLGVCWTGTEFAALAGNGLTVREHTGELKSEGFGGIVSLYPGHTWYDSDLIGGPHETTIGGTAARSFTKRAKHRLTTSARVPINGGTDDPNGARFFVGRSATRTKLQLQGVHSPGAGEYAELEIAALTLPVGTADAVTPPPATGDFPMGTAYRHYSEAVDSAGNPLVEIRGDGYAGGEGLRPVGEITMYYAATPPAGWLVCNGGTFSSVTYPRLFAFLGSTTLPDLRSRFPVGAGTYTALKESEGNSEGVRSPRHDHAAGGLVTGPPIGVVQRQSAASPDAAGGNHTHNVTGRTGFNLGAAADGESQFPRLGVNFIIRAA